MAHQRRTPLEKLQYDPYYIKNMSMFLDFHILLKTVRVMLFRKGARCGGMRYGVS
jgi:lipopolysaccharide/colanic/teichoic acid biosynthesis glycosyltransferase